MKRGLVLFLGFLLTTNLKAQEPSEFFSEVRSSDSKAKTLTIPEEIIPINKAIIPNTE